VGISADQVDRQHKFDEQNSLGFPLLSDPDKSVHRVFGTRRVGPLPARRATFVIDTGRRVRKTIRSETDFLTHADEALEALRSLS